MPKTKQSKPAPKLVKLTIAQIDAELVVLTALSSSQEASKCLLNIHRTNGGHSLQRLLNRGWGNHNSSLSCVLDRGIETVLAEAGPPQLWRHPFTNFAVIALKSLPSEQISRYSKTLTWLELHFRELQLSIKILILSQLGISDHIATYEHNRQVADAISSEAQSQEISPILNLIHSLLCEANRQQNYQGAVKVILIALKRQVPIAEKFERKIYETIQQTCTISTAASCLTAFGDVSLMHAVAKSKQRVLLIKHVQILAIETLIHNSNSKGALKLFNKYGLDESECPNVRHACERAALSWHVSSGNLDFLEGLLTRRNDLLPIVKHLWSKKRNHSIENFIAQTLNGSPSDFCSSDKKLLQGLRRVVAFHNQNEADAQNKSTTYTTKCTSVEFVDSREKVAEMAKYITEKSGNLFAFDCEWSPVLSSFEKQICAILSIATRGRGFLLDCIALHSIQELKGPNGENSVVQMLNDLFGNPCINNVGYATRGDMKILHSTFPCFNTLTKKSPNHVDMSNGKYVSLLLHNKGISLQAKPRSLQQMVKVILGKDIPKSSQISDWLRRPLHPSQVSYAINDADVIISLWDVGKFSSEL